MNEPGCGGHAGRFREYNGYLVEFAYQTEAEEAGDESSMLRNGSTVWRTRLIWPVVVFRSCRDALLTRQNLLRRRRILKLLKCKKLAALHIKHHAAVIGTSNSTQNRYSLVLHSIRLPPLPMPISPCYRREHGIGFGGGAPHAAGWRWKAGSTEFGSDADAFESSVAEPVCALPGQRANDSSTVFAANSRAEFP